MAAANGSTDAGAAAERRLQFAMLEELAAMSQKHGGGELDGAVASLSAALGLDLEDGENIAALSYKPYASLGRLFNAGVEALQVKTVGEEKAAMEADPLFTEYMKKITDKGFFKGLEEGSKAYLERWAKAAGKFKEKQQATTGTGGKPATAPGEVGVSKPAAAAAAAAGPEPSEADKARADELKSEGNKAIQAKDFKKAEKLYTQALALVSTGQPAAVYHCNRAAARAFLNDDDGAKADSARAVELDPNYAKAHSRLGYACYQLGEYQEAIEAYKRAVALDPSSAANQEFLEKAQKKLQARRERDAVPTADAGAASGFGAGGMPDFSALAGMMGGMGGGGGGGGGMGGLSGMMNNPGFMQMAQSMMQNPEMMRRAQEMMSNPDMMAQAQSMLSGMGMGGMPGAGGGGGGGGEGEGAPDLNDLMSRLGGGGGGGGGTV